MNPRLVWILLVLPGFGAQTGGNRPPAATVPVSIASPAPEGSLAPGLAVTPDGRAVLSWLEPAGSGRHRFRYSVRASQTWSEPVTLADEVRMFANWADRPGLEILPDGTWMAHWLTSTARGAYDIKVITSSDGVRWSTPLTPHRDGTRTEHGFVSMARWPGGAPGLIWLDGRDFAKHASHGPEAMKGEMALRATTLTNGAFTDEVIVDNRVCECCPTSLAATSQGLIAAYRDRSQEEIRDIYVARFENGRWLEPKAVHADGWQIPGCPVNGPAIDARGDHVAIAWFTAVGNDGRVNVAFSSDAGRSFGAPVRVDDGQAIGRVDLALLPTGRALVLWIEYNKGDSDMRLRTIEPAGSRGPAVHVAPVRSDRSSGYPRMAVVGHEVVLAWTANGIKTAVLRLPG